MDGSASSSQDVLAQATSRSPQGGLQLERSPEPQGLPSRGSGAALSSTVIHRRAHPDDELLGRPVSGALRSAQSPSTSEPGPVRGGREAGRQSLSDSLRGLLTRLSELREVEEDALPGPSSVPQPNPANGHDADQDQGSIQDLLLRELSRRSQDRRSGELSAAALAAAGGSVDEGTEGTAAEAAARHRMGSASGMELQAVAVWLEHLLPFLLLLFLVFLYHHWMGLLIFCWLMAASMRGNDILQRQVSNHQEKSVPRIIVALGFFLVHIVIVLYLLQSEDVQFLYGALLPGSLSSVWDALYIASLADMLVRFCGMWVKAGVLAFLPRGKPSKRQGQLMTAVEYMLLTARTASPSGVWYKYFLSCGLGPVTASVFAGCYLSLKLSSFLGKLSFAMQAVRTLVDSRTPYGQYASHEEVMEVGNCCSICQEEMKNPLRLPCKHIFCEACVSEWFERERTCPLCRQVIREAGIRSFADGRTTTAPQVF